MNQKYKNGLIVGLSNTIITHPIDTMRLRIFFDTKNINIKDAYKGINFNLVTSSIKMMLNYPTQEYFENKFVKSNNSKLYSGILTGLLIGIFATPINNIKIPLQIHNHGVLDATKKIYNSYGIKGFTRGGLSTLMRDISWNALYFPVYSYFSEDLKYNKIISSIMASMLSTTVAYPLDGIRLYRQNYKQNYNFIHGLEKSLELSRINFKSYCIAITRVPLSTMFTHMFYLYLNKKEN